MHNVLSYPANNLKQTSKQTTKRWWNGGNNAFFEE